MYKVIKKEIEWCGKKISLETGRIGLHADGAVLVKSGETTLLCTAVASKKPLEGVDFLPLTVVYREMTAAAGKIPGGFFKREGRPSEYEVLTSRLIDRPVRPLFPKGFSHELQVICTLLSYDGETSSDILAMIGASAALTISGVPFLGPIAGIRVGMVEGEFVANPAVQDVKESDLDLVIAGTKDSILMVESEASELAEDKMLEALEFGHKQMQPIFNLISDLDKEVKNPKWNFEAKTLDNQIVEYVRSEVGKDLENAYTEKKKKIRGAKLSEIKEKLFEKTDFEKYSEFEISLALKSVQEDVVRQSILKKGKRIDGRDNKSIRDIVTEVSVLDRTHGSALFTRGETQALVTTTLGSVDDEQMIDSLDGMTKENFMLHYNFLPYCVGEVSMLRAPGRREVGHGKLAWRAIRPMLPTKEDFPYTIRTVSEITGCNGSSSMATVCGASLSMMDAGVPLKDQVAGIAMGLMMDAGDKFVVLSDILGDEDALGDMDFKVAGTKSGITALQMDIKIAGVTFKIMKEALAQAKEGRLHILKEMNKSLAESRKDISKHAPAITKITINKNKIGALIGPGGKNIKEICEKTGAKVDIDDSGTVFIAATNAESSEQAIEMVNAIVFEPEIGAEYDGVVTKMLDFGAVVSFMGGKEGLLHISEIQEERVENIHDVLKEKDTVKVRVIGMDERKGKIKLSTKPSSGNSNSGKSDSKPSTDHKKKNSDSKPSAKKKNEKKDKPKDNSEGVSKKKYFNF
ncbi:MAG: polyribonucleotide nucleotidyltransferase [Alphaproteobacteria bacterium]|nr:polyribonucleotide nucleotidyltransferase [Alphaproteobacteria bacterium]